MNDMEQKKKMPQVRFKGYDDTWEQRKVSDIATITAGGTPSTVEIEYWQPKEIPWLSSGEIHKKYVMETDNMISKKGLENSSAKWVEKGSVLIALAGQGKTRGTAAITRIRLTTNQSISALKFGDNVYPDYAFQNLDSRYDELRNVSSGDGTRGGLNKQLLSDLEMMIPEYEEQKKLGDYFSNLDTLITLHQRKYDKLIKMKRAMLEKMFPKNGSLYPEIRFEGFTDAWEQRKLENISDVKDGTHDSPKYVQNGHPFITSKNVGDGFINYDDIQYVSDKDYDEINRRSKVDIHDILMGMIGTIGNLALIREKPDFAIKNVALIKYTGDIDYKFLYQILQSHCVTSQLLNSIDGGTQKFIALNKIRGLDIPYPGEEEQRKIGLFFEQLDNLITLHQRKLEKLKNIKKACLEKMFV